MSAELLPVLARYRPGERAGIELRDAPGAGTVQVFHLGEEVARIDEVEGGVFTIDGLPEGGYGVEWSNGGERCRTALDVRADDRSRLRYGFTVDYRPDRDPAGLADTVRRLHLTDVQFYDWAYRHADLLGGGEVYEDALGQPVSLDAVRRLVAAVGDAGARALGYAAVYAVGPAEWDDWKRLALLTGSGEPYALGDFLFILDPAAPEWLDHFGADLEKAVRSAGFHGFHLDQYGYPKVARRADGASVDLSASFESLIRTVRTKLPEARLVFNNVNDFPTWRTASAPQDAVYIEVWEPTTTLGGLAATVDRARAAADGKPVVIAAYQHVYDSAPAEAADRATALTMATLFSHGATQLLAGEADRILVDPYYVRNHTVEASTAALLARWYDFLVEHDQLLLDPAINDVTRSYAGSYNDDIEVSFASASVSDTPCAGHVWRRVTETAHGLVVHLINLTGQSDVLWDGAKKAPDDPGEATLRIRAVCGSTPRVRVADPDGSGRLMDIPVVVGGDYAEAKLPSPRLWQLVLIELDRNGMT